MKLTWHIVRKDFARLKIPLGLWLAFVVVTTVWFGVTAPPVYATTADLLSTWIGTLLGSGIAGVCLQATVGALLTVVLVLEDRPTGTVGFWLTRPICGRRLLVAKAMGATLFFAVLPAMVLAIVWLAFGFTLRDTGLAAVEFAGWQVAVSVPVLALAVATGSLGRFVFAALGVWLLVVSTVVVGGDSYPREGFRGEWIDARAFAVVGVLVVGAGLVFGRSYLGKRRPAWVLLVATPGLMIGVRVGWHDFSAPARSAAVAAPAPWEQLAARLEESLLQTATGKNGVAPVPSKEAPGLPQVAGLRARVLWELPLQEGVQAGADSTRTRLLHIGWTEDRAKRRIVVQEREARLAADYGIRSSLGENEVRRRDTVKADVFFLVNRSRGYVRRLAMIEVGTARMNSVLRRAGILEIAPAVPIGVEFARWDDGAAIIKVRLTHDGEGADEAVNGTAAVKQEKQP